MVVTGFFAQCFPKVSEADQFFPVDQSEKVFHLKNRAISKPSAQDAAPGMFLTSGLKLGI